MIELVWCFGKVEKSVMVDENYIFPSYGDKVNEFNLFLIVSNVENRDGKVFITLKYEYQ